MCDMLRVTCNVRHAMHDYKTSQNILRSFELSLQMMIAHPLVEICTYAQANMTNSRGDDKHCIISVRMSHM